MSHDLTPLGVVLFSIASAISGELINWILVYRTSSYRALKENLSRHAKKLEEAKSSGSGSKNIKKLEARLDTWKTEASARVAGINMRTGLIVRGLEGGRAASLAEQRGHQGWGGLDGLGRADQGVSSM